MDKLTVYARRVLPRNIGEQVLPPKYPQQYDVEITDKGGKVLGRFPWYYASKPDKRFKHLMLNCYRYKLEWKDT